jgi:hypothetical protein
MDMKIQIYCCIISIAMLGLFDIHASNSTTQVLPWINVQIIIGEPAVNQQAMRAWSDFSFKKLVTLISAKHAMNINTFNMIAPAGLIEDGELKNPNADPQKPFYLNIFFSEKITPTPFNALQIAFCSSSAIQKQRRWQDLAELQQLSFYYKDNVKYFIDTIANPLFANQSIDRSFKGKGPDIYTNNMKTISAFLLVEKTRYEKNNPNKTKLEETTNTPQTTLKKTPLSIMGLTKKVAENPYAAAKFATQAAVENLSRIEFPELEKKLEEHIAKSNTDYNEKIHKKKATLKNAEYLAYLLESYDYFSLYDYRKGSTLTSWIESAKSFFGDTNTKKRIHEIIKKNSEQIIRSLEQLIDNASKTYITEKPMDNVMGLITQTVLGEKMVYQFTKQEEETYGALYDTIKKSLLYQYAIKEVAGELPIMKELSDKIKSCLYQIDTKRPSKPNIKKFIEPLYQINDLFKQMNIFSTYDEKNIEAKINELKKKNHIFLTVKRDDWITKFKGLVAEEAKVFLPIALLYGIKYVYGKDIKVDPSQPITEQIVKAVGALAKQATQESALENDVTAQAQAKVAELVAKRLARGVLEKNKPQGPSLLQRLSSTISSKIKNLFSWFWGE